MFYIISEKGNLNVNMYESILRLQGAQQQQQSQSISSDSSDCKCDLLALISLSQVFSHYINQKKCWKIVNS